MAAENRYTQGLECTSQRTSTDCPSMGASTEQYASKVPLEDHDQMFARHMKISLGAHSNTNFAVRYFTMQCFFLWQQLLWVWVYQ